MGNDVSDCRADPMGKVHRQNLRKTFVVGGVISDLGRVCNWVLTASERQQLVDDDLALVLSNELLDNEVSLAHKCVGPLAHSRASWQERQRQLHLQLE